MAYGLPYGMASRNVALCIIFIAALLHVSLGQTPPKSEVLPEFLALLENHTVTQGRDVSFTCVVNHLQSYKVAWIKSDSRAILAIHTHMVAHNPRLSVTHNGHNTWKLHVTNVQPNDSGTYMCQVNTDPMRSQTGHMKVVIPPDIMDLDDIADQLTTKENGDLRLRCVATGTPAPMVIWRREDGRNITLRNEHGVMRKCTSSSSSSSSSGTSQQWQRQPYGSPVSRGKATVRLAFLTPVKVGESSVVFHHVGHIETVRTYEGEQLHLRGILRQEMGSYLCIASNGVPPSVSKRYYVNVRFKPLIKVSNQLVAAPLDSDVLLQCYVESSPKALNTWHRNNGVKLLEDEKHDISEVTINDYAYQLNLTVRRLDRSDFGTYTCSAENAYGKADGTIRLQELHLPRPTVTSTSNTEVIEKHTWRKQTEKKGKYSYVVDKPDSELSPKNVGHTTPMSRRNVSSSSPSNVANKSRMSVFPAPAPAPAHSAPTQSGGQNGVRSSHDPRLRCVGLALAVLVILALSD